MAKLPLILKLTLVMSFLTKLGVTGILRSFRLVLKGKAGKEIPRVINIRVFQKFSANNVALLELVTFHLSQKTTSQDHYID